MLKIYWAMLLWDLALHVQHLSRFHLTKSPPTEGVLYLASRSQSICSSSSKRNFQVYFTMWDMFLHFEFVNLRPFGLWRDKPHIKILLRGWNVTKIVRPMYLTIFCYSKLKSHCISWGILCYISIRYHDDILYINGVYYKNLCYFVLISFFIHLFSMERLSQRYTRFYLVNFSIWHHILWILIILCR
jgi:hypothetical protein